jgi:hypothetical protein
MVSNLVNKTIVFFTTLIFLLVVVTTVSAMPLTPMSIDGSVTIDGKTAPEGTVITAKMNGVQVDKYVVQSDGKYMLTIEGEYEDIGKTIEFFVNGIDTDNIEKWESGSIVTTDLAISSSVDNSDKASLSTSSSNSYTNYPSENDSDSEYSNTSGISENEITESNNDYETSSNIASDSSDLADNSSSSTKIPGFTSITCVIGLVILCIATNRK